MIITGIGEGFCTALQCKKSGKLVRGLRCKACDKPITVDPELCAKCLEIAMRLVQSNYKSFDETTSQVPNKQDTK